MEFELKKHQRDLRQLRKEKMKSAKLAKVKKQL